MVGKITILVTRLCKEHWCVLRSPKVCCQSTHDLLTTPFCQMLRKYTSSKCGRVIGLCIPFSLLMVLQYETPGDILK